MGEIFTAEIAEAAEKRLKKIGHRRTQTHTDSKLKGERSKLKGKNSPRRSRPPARRGTILRLGEKRPRLPARRAEPTARRVKDRREENKENWPQIHTDTHN